MLIPSRSKQVLCVLALSSFACAKKNPPEATETGAVATVEAPAEAAAAAAAPDAAAAKLEAKKTFDARCSVCHGANGAGDGPGSAALNPKPRNYTDPAWQNSVTDEQIRSVILMGGAAVGKSPIMPASPDLQSKPEIVDELVKIVRSFKQG
jgi:mono/diheme cytochrome c family protein